MTTPHSYLAFLADEGTWAAPTTNGHPRPAVHGPPARPDDPGGPRYGHAALLDEANQLAAATEGHRNHTLNLAAFRLGRIVALGWVAEHDAEDALRAAALATGLAAAEIEATLSSGLAAGKQAPRDVVLRVGLPDTTVPGSAAGTPSDLAGALDSAPSEGAESGADSDGGHGDADGLTSSADAERDAALALYHARCVAEEVRKLTVRADARRIHAAQQRPPDAGPELLRLDELLSRPRTVTTWRIHDWQPSGGRVLLAAQYKAGKTTLTGNLARCLVDGTPWLGKYPIEPVAGTVVILDFEMGTNQLGDWLRDQRIYHTESVIVVPMRGKASHFDILDPATLAEWAARLRHAHAGYLVVDCLRPILDTLGLDEHRDAGQFLVALDALLLAAGVPDACLVHHMGHGAERSRGDSRIRDWPDVEWRIVRQDDDPSSPRYITAFGRDVDIPETQLGHDSGTRHLFIAGGSRREARATSALFDVLAALEEAGQPLTGRDVERWLTESDHGRQAVREALKAGVRHGTILSERGPRRSIYYRRTPQNAKTPVSAASAPAH